MPGSLPGGTDISFPIKPPVGPIKPPPVFPPVNNNDTKDGGVNAGITDISQTGSVTITFDDSYKLSQNSSDWDNVFVIYSGNEE